MVFLCLDLRDVQNLVFKLCRETGTPYLSITIVKNPDIKNKIGMKLCSES
jgi:hypothetical protein